jgi:hypothetical protein
MLTQVVITATTVPMTLLQRFEANGKPVIAYFKLAVHLLLEGKL